MPLFGPPWTTSIYTAHRRGFVQKQQLVVLSARVANSFIGLTHYYILFNVGPTLFQLHNQQEIRSVEHGFHCFKSTTCDHGHNPFGVIHRPVCSTSHGLSNKEKTKGLASSVKKLWSPRSQNLKSRSRDPGHTQFGGHSSSTM